MKAQKKFYVVVYDIKDNSPRDKVSKILEKYGQRVNYSVFECLFTEKQLLSVQTQIYNLICKNSDTVIYYSICLDCYTKIIYHPKRNPPPTIVKVV